MATIFCPDCGAKAAYTINKPKFCQTCGIKFGEVSTAATAEYETEEGVPHLEGLEYVIEMDTSNKTTLGSLFSNPLNPASVTPIEEKRQKGRPKKQITESKKDFLVRSMAECASSKQQPAITEDGAE